MQPQSRRRSALEVGGRAIQTRSVTVAPHGSASITFDPVTVAERNVRASVRLADDALARDNVFHFVVSPEDPLRGGDRRTARCRTRNASLYLARALAVSESPRIDARVRPADSLSPEDLAQAAVVILNDAPVAQTTADRLKVFVERGGGVFLAMGERARLAVGGRHPAGRARAAGRSHRADAAARLGALEYGHPLFEVFRGPRTGDFASARFYSYRSVTPRRPTCRRWRGSTMAQPALLERRVGTGRVLMWTSTLDTAWNDLALKPVFVPFVHRILRHLGVVSRAEAVADGRRRRRSGFAGAGAGRSDVSRVALTPGGQRISLDGDGPEVLELAEQGFYEFRTQGRDSDTPVVVASNVDLRESDLAADGSAGDRGRGDGPGRRHGCGGAHRAAH